ncbi:MAG TPA: hypothetical protein VGN22_21655, partial [Pseudonocardia sp.]
YEVEAALERLREVQEHGTITGDAWQAQRREAWSGPDSEFPQQGIGLPDDESSDDHLFSDIEHGDEGAVTLGLMIGATAAVGALGVLGMVVSPGVAAAVGFTGAAVAVMRALRARQAAVRLPGPEPALLLHARRAPFALAGSATRSAAVPSVLRRLTRLFDRRGPPRDARERRGGAVAVAGQTGEPTRLDDREYAETVQRLERAFRHGRMREIRADSRTRTVMDPASVWAVQDPRVFAVTGLNGTAPARFAVVMFVAPDPVEPGRPAVFVDEEVLARLPLLDEAERELLAHRELARLRGLAEDDVQAMRLPAAEILLALVRPQHGAEFWARGWAELGRLAGTPRDRRSDRDKRLVRLLTDAVDHPVAADGDWGFLDGPSRLTDHARWAARGWQAATTQQRLEAGVAAVVSPVGDLSRRDAPVTVMSAARSKVLLAERSTQLAAPITDELVGGLTSVNLVLAVLADPVWALVDAGQHAAQITEERLRLAELIWGAAVLDRGRGTSYRLRVWRQLERVATRPSDQLTSSILSMVAEALGQTHLPIEWGFLEQPPAWVLDALAAAHDGAVPGWFPGFWRHARHEAKEWFVLGLATISAAGPGIPRYVVELSKDQRSAQQLRGLWRWSDWRSTAGPVVAAAEALFELAPPRDAAQFVGAGMRLIQVLTRARPVFDTAPAVAEEVTDRLTDLAARLADLTTRRGPGAAARCCPGLIDELTHSLRHEVLARPLAAALGAELDPALPIPADMPAVLGRLILHDEVATDTTMSMVARYLEVWQRSGSREQATAGAWEHYWTLVTDEAGDQPFVARERAPPDVAARIVDADGGGLIDAVVGVENDPIEILLGARDCVQCEFGVRREHAQDWLRPRLAMLRVWHERRGGRVLASLYVGVPDLHSVVRNAERVTTGLPDRIVQPLSQPFDSTDPRMGTVLTDYVQAWAVQVGALGLTEFFDEPQQRRPNLVVPADAVEARVSIRFPADSLYEPVYSEALFDEYFDTQYGLDLQARL